MDCIPAPPRPTPYPGVPEDAAPASGPTGVAAELAGASLPVATARCRVGAPLGGPRAFPWGSTCFVAAAEGKGHKERRHLTRSGTYVMWAIWVCCRYDKIIIDH